MGKIKIVNEADLVKEDVAYKRYCSFNEEPGSKMQKESVRDAIFSIYRVETIDELFAKIPQPEVDEVVEKINDVLEKEVDALGYS